MAVSGSFLGSSASKSSRCSSSRPSSGSLQVRLNQANLTLTLTFFSIPLCTCQLLHRPNSLLPGLKLALIFRLNFLFQHFFLKDWDEAREIHAYPPCKLSVLSDLKLTCYVFSALGKNALYRKSEFYEFVDFAATNLAQIEDDALCPFFR